MDDRIDALLSDIEGAEVAAQAHARRGEYGDELAAHAAERTLSERLRATLGQTVKVTVSSREITGEAIFLGRDIYVIAGIETSIIAIEQIRQLRGSTRRHRLGSGPLERLGMASALRRLGAEHAEITIEIAGEGGIIRGCSELVTADYLEVAGRIIPFSAIAVIQSRSNPFS